LAEIARINPDIVRIILTGYATLDRAIDAVNLGIDGFLTKPFINKELRTKIREFGIRKRLKQLVSEQVFQELQKSDTGLSPRNQRVSVLFTDIRGFTELTEKMTPQEITDILNTYYFLPLDRIVFEYNGTLDKHIGDSVMAIFGAPVSYADDTLRAVSCAVRMREKMAEINRSLSERNMKIPVGIGIGTGDAMAGMLGSPIKKEYTVLGAPVNLASRLERIAMEDQILICRETYLHIRDAFKVTAIDHVNLKGIEGEKSIFNVIGKI
jgi:class 3 adenylate cyclase